MKRRPTRSPENGNGAVFSITTKEIVRVSSDITVAPEPAELSGSLKVAAGAKNAKEDEGKADEKKKVLQSMAAAEADIVSDFFGG